MKIKKIKDFKESYIQEIMSHVEESLAIKERQLNSDSENLQAGAANFYLSEYAKLEKEFRNTEAEDLADTIYRRKSKVDKTKDEKILKLTFDEEEDTGTEG